MEPQNQVMVENLFHGFCFQGFWRLSYVDGVGAILPYPKSLAYFNQWFHSGYKMFLLVELVFLKLLVVDVNKGKDIIYT